MASMALRSETLGLWQPSGWGGRGGRSGTIRSQRMSGMRHWSSWTGVEVDFETAPALAIEGISWGEIKLQKILRTPTGIGSKEGSSRRLLPCSFSPPYQGGVGGGSELTLACVQTKRKPLQERYHSAQDLCDWLAILHEPHGPAQDGDLH